MVIQRLFLKDLILNFILIQETKSIGEDSKINILISCLQITLGLLHGPRALDHPFKEVLAHGNGALLYQFRQDIINYLDVVAQVVLSEESQNVFSCFCVGVVHAFVERCKSLDVRDDLEGYDLGEAAMAFSGLAHSIGQLLELSEVAVFYQ